MKRITWGIFGWLVLLTAAQAASFDCSKAQSKTEHFICDTPSISKLDDELGKSYQEAIGKANEEQKRRLVIGQKDWLKRFRNICTDEPCFEQAYSSRLSALKTFFEPETQLQRGDWTYRYGVGKNEPLCHELLRRLNRYDRNESLDNRCSLNAIATYPEFSEPPWEDLDTKKYEELIAELEKYIQETPDAYFHRLPGLKEWAPAEYYRRKTKEFIEYGGRLQVWRTKLSSFNFSNPKGSGNSSNEQTVVRLSGGFPRLPPSKELDEKLSNICKGMPRLDLDWPGTIIYVTSDLVGPDPAVDTGTFGIVRGHDLKIYEDKPILIGSESIWRDSQYGLTGYCDFEFAELKK